MLNSRSLGCQNLNALSLPTIPQSFGACRRWNNVSGKNFVGKVRKVFSVVLINDEVLDALAPCRQRNNVNGKSCKEMLIGDSVHRGAH